MSQLYTLSKSQLMLMQDNTMTREVYLTRQYIALSEITGQVVFQPSKLTSPP